MKSLLVISGPNLNLLGEREPEIYGTETLHDHIEAARAQAEESGFKLDHVQSNHEGEIVEAIQGAGGRYAAIIINAAAFSHYSWAIHDSLRAFDEPVVELHISNPGAREDFRHQSVITPAATAVISGLGGAGYPFAVRAAATLVDS